MKELSAKQIHGAIDNKKPDPPTTEDELLVSSTSSPSPQTHEEFVNTGAQKWEEIRREWLASSSAFHSLSSSSSKSSSSTTSTSSLFHPTKKPKRHAQDIDVDEVIELIISNRWRQQPPPPPPKHHHATSSTSSLDTTKSSSKNNSSKRDDACFPNPISLPQMVDVLVDLWEAEGLDI